jgi:hypothetical protein
MARITMRNMSSPDGNCEARRHTAAPRRDNLTAYAAEIPLKLNLTIWRAAINCTLVVRDILVASLCRTLV